MFTLLVINFGIANIVEAGLIFKAPSSTAYITQKPPCGGMGDPISMGVKTWYLSALYQYYKDCQVGACG